MITDLSFIRQILNSQIESYEYRISEGLPPDGFKESYSINEVLAEKIAALQEFKMNVINFIAEANKLTEEQK